MRVLAHRHSTRWCFMRIVTPATVASAAAMTAFDVAMMTLDITMKAAAASLAFEGVDGH